MAGICGKEVPYNAEIEQTCNHHDMSQAEIFATMTRDHMTHMKTCETG